MTVSLVVSTCPQTTTRELVHAPESELIAHARAGSKAAYAELFLRHRDAARSLAVRLNDRDDVDDLVAEAFSRVLALLVNGAGPRTLFRPYLLAAVRNIYRNLGRVNNRELLHPEPHDAVADSAADDGVDERLEHAGIARAFRLLPGRWQTVLWLSEVESRPVAEIAEILNIKPNAVSALAFRAREGLRHAYLADHVGTPASAGCRQAVEHLPSYLRGTLTTRRRETLNQHLASCAACSTMLGHLIEVNQYLS